MKRHHSAIARLVSIWLAACLVAASASATDTDDDGIVDGQDNCSQLSNVAQCDADEDGYGNACDADFDQNEVVTASDIATHLFPAVGTGVDTGNGTDMDCDGEVDVRDFGAFAIPQYSILGHPGPSGLACAGSSPCTATGAGPARTPMLEAHIYVEPVVIIEDDFGDAPALGTVFHTQRVIDEAGEVLQGGEDEDDFLCPVGFTATDVRAMPDPAVGLPQGHFWFRDAEGGQTTHVSGWIGLGEEGDFEAYFREGARGIGRVYAHEWGHRAGLVHGIEVQPSQPGYGVSSVMGHFPGLPGREHAVAEDQCDAYQTLAESQGTRDVSNCLVDPDLSNPSDALEPADAWTVCNDGSGYCDGHGRCIPADLECFTDGVGPDARGTACTRADGVCRACDGGGTCAPCDRDAEPQVAAEFFYTTGPGAGGDRDALVRLGDLPPLHFASRPHEIVLELGRDVTALAAPHDDSFVFYGVAPEAPGDDVLLRIDAAAASVDELDSLDHAGVHDLTLVSSAGDDAELLAVVEDGGVSTLLRIEVDGASVTVTEIDSIGLEVTGLSWNPITDTLHAWANDFPDTGLVGGVMIDPATAEYEYAFFALPFDAGLERSWAFLPLTGTSIDFDSSDYPDFAIDAPFAPAITPICGNGEVEGAEECDDGNVYDGDGCTAACETASPASGALDDPDSDGVDTFQDNCPAASNASQTDTDDDGAGDACELCDRVPNANPVDGDADGVPDACDNAPAANANQLDTDGDGRGDASDNCPAVATYDSVFSLAGPDQTDTDGDGYGDACDSNPDGDMFGSDADGSGTAGDNPCEGGSTTSCDDNCPLHANAGQQDDDSDGIGDICDDECSCNDPELCRFDAFNDADGDQLCHQNGSGTVLDNCPQHNNPGQQDTDSDGIGNACDVCRTVADPDQEDADSDGRGDACDNCPSVPNPPVPPQGPQADDDEDGIGDACDPDFDGDGDGILDDGDASGTQGDAKCLAGDTTLCDDNCPDHANADQADMDSDALGNACDPDLDGDGVPQVVWVFPTFFCGEPLANPAPDCDDNCPLIANADQANADGDSLGDACE
jgi:hypothetical protein